MRKSGPVQEKAFKFALDVVKYCSYLIKKKKEFVISKQLIRYGTSIGANIEEAQFAESKNDFIHKMSISLKEAFESRYWLRIIIESGSSKPETPVQLLHDIDEIIALLVSIVKSSKNLK